MNPLQLAIAVLAFFLVATGLFTLVAAWAWPRLLDNRFMRWLVTGDRLPPTRANRTLMAVWCLLIGGYFLLTTTGFRMLGYLAFAAWVPLAFVAIKRRSKPPAADWPRTRIP